MAQHYSFQAREQGEAFMSKISEMARLCQSLMRAYEFKGYTVKYLNPLAPRDAERALTNSERLIFFGVKDTSQINLEIIKKLRLAQGHVWLTVDLPSYKGRAIDTLKVNPVTGGVMTGSSSGSAINVLYGINDLAIGTDGGGSVLGPAISCGLYGIVGTGIGLSGTRKRISTDKLPFVPGIGILSRDLSTGMKGIEYLTDHAISVDLIQEEELYDIKVGIPSYGCVELPVIGDMRENLDRIVGNMQRFGANLTELDLHGCDDRGTGLTALSKALSEVDLVVTYEGPVDLFGLGDSVLGGFGETGKCLKNRAGKYLLRAANMSGATAVILPGPDFACGILILARPGLEPAKKALKLALELDSFVTRSDLFYEYFRQQPEDADDLFFGGDYFDHPES